MGRATSALNNVRARAAEIDEIAKKFVEIRDLQQQMNQIVVEQGVKVEAAFENTENVVAEVTQANTQLDGAVVHAKSRNKYKRWCFFVGSKFCIPILYIRVLY